MKQSLMSNSWWLPMVFSLYETLVMWFLGFPEFATSKLPSWQLLFGLFFALLLVSKLVEIVLKKYLLETAKRNVWMCLTTTVIVAIVAWFGLQIATIYALSFFSGFLLSTVVFVVFYYLLILLQDIPSGLTLNKGETDETAAIAVLAIDQKGRSRLELPLNTIICFEANDNYVTIHYLNAEQKPVKRLERLSMRKVEELLSSSGELFLRVHKSFLVNRNFVQEITGKSQAYRIRLNYLEETIPVSRNVKIREILPNH